MKANADYLKRNLRIGKKGNMEMEERERQIMERKEEIAKDENKNGGEAKTRNIRKKKKQQMKANDKDKSYLRTEKNNTGMKKWKFDNRLQEGNSKE